MLKSKNPEIRQFNEHNNNNFKTLEQTFLYTLYLMKLLCEGNSHKTKRQ